jgi:hypothetical protein
MSAKPKSRSFPGILAHGAPAPAPGFVSTSGSVERLYEIIVAVQRKKLLLCDAA